MYGRCVRSLVRFVGDGMSNRWIGIWVCVAILATGASVRAADNLVWDGKEWKTAVPPKPGSPEAAVANIRVAIKNDENTEALDLSEKFLETHGGSILSEEVLNLSGIAAMQNGQYWKAYHWFEQQVGTYPSGQYFERALTKEYEIADAYLKGRRRKVWKGMFRLKAYSEGLDILTQISVHTPGTALAEKALTRMADYYFEDEQYPEAVQAYDEFVRQSPHSSRRPYAMLQAARACLLDYRGIEFDQATLIDASERYRVFAQAFPKAATQENVRGILREIRLAQAHKLFHAGKFYERIGQPKAAAFYYAQCIRQYKDTHWADSARGRLDLLAGNLMEEYDTETRDDSPLRPLLKPTQTEPKTDKTTPSPKPDNKKKPGEEEPIRLDDLEPTSAKPGTAK
jgi:outer membrane assembly lipoprotein YfiO